MLVAVVCSGMNLPQSWKGQWLPMRFTDKEIAADKNLKRTVLKGR